MSGIVGSITAISREFNDLKLNNTIKGIKMANYFEGKIKDAELEKQTTQVQEKTTEEIDPVKLVSDIQDDMTR